MPEPRIGFLGIGIMGEAMVLRLLERGRPVTVWNLEPERLDRVVPHGAVAAPTPAAGKVLLDHSTADPAATREMAARLRAETGMGWVDAPVSGGPQAARGGTLTIMMGGDPGEIAALGPVLRDLGTNVTRMGPAGAGQTTKVLNQAIVGTGFVLMAEALAMAEAAGLDAAALPAGLAGGHADGSLLQKIYAQMQRRDFEPPTSYARQLLKDLKAVKAFAHDLDLELPLVETAVARFADYVAGGNEMVDSASVIRLYRPDP